jgi:hypothetical protein
VQLEDHIFTLQAHFLARSATVVHDYTCYHWVRADTATPPPHQGTDVIDYVRSVGVILDIIEHHVPPGSLRDMMIARWHQVKLLNRLDERVLKQDPAVFRTAYDAIAGLVRERVPLSADEYLPVNLRVRSAVLRAGGPAAVMALARHEAGTALVSRIESLQWRDGRLAVGLTSDLVREDRTGSRSPVRFVREGERIRWDLPAGLLALPGVPAAADVTEAMPATALRPYVRHREEHTDLYIPADQRITTVPLGRNAAGLPLMALRVEGTALLDPAAADHGQSVNGLWDFNVLLDTCGWSRTRRIGDDRSPLADAQLRAAFLADGRLAAPYWTKFGNLSIRIAPATLGGLKGTARETDLAHAAEDTGGMLRVRLPLELAPLRQPVPLVVTLSESDDAEPLLVQGTVLPNGSPELAELQFAVSVGALGGGSRWAIQLEQPGRTSRPADLGVQLRRSAPGTWSLV